MSRKNKDAIDQLLAVTVANLALPLGTWARKQRVWDAVPWLLISLVWRNSQSLAWDCMIRKPVGSLWSHCSLEGRRWKPAGKRYTHSLQAP